MTFPTDRLAALRAAKGFSQKALADNLGVSIRTVQRWEAGDSQPFPRDVRALFTLFPEAADARSKGLAGTDGKKRGR